MRSPVKASFLLLVSFAVPFAYACSSSESPATPAPADGGADGDSSASDFTVYVAEPVDPFTPYKPLSGVSAFIDAADGSRIEATSDADGKIVFKGVSFENGPAAVTAFTSGHVMSTVVGVTPETLAKLPLPFAQFPNAGKNLVLVLSPIAPPGNTGTVKLTGNLAGKLDAANNVTMSALPGSSVFQADTATYSFDVKKDAALTVVAMEWTKGDATARSWDETKHRFVKFDVPAQSANGTHDFDFATGTALTSKKVTLTLKAPDASNLGGPAGWQVQSLKSEGLFFLGSRSKVPAPPTGNTFVAEGEYVDSPVANDEVITFCYFPGFDGESAIVQLDGAPADGSTIEAFAFPNTPAATKVGGEIALGNVDPGAESVGIDIVKHEAGSLGGFVDTPLWNVQTLRGSGTPLTIKLPELPEGASASLPATAQARIVVAGDSLSAAHQDIPKRLAWSKFFRVSK
jgi:hypothetical protein